MGRVISHYGRILAALLAMAILASAAACGTATTSATGKTTATTTATPTLKNWTTIKTPQPVVALRFAPSDPTVGYLCADNGPAAPPLAKTPQLYKSTDSGKSWRLLSSAPKLYPAPTAAATSTSCNVFVDVNDANDVFWQAMQLEDMGGGGDPIVRLLFRSRDGGATWGELGTLDETNGFTNLVVDGSRLIAQPKPTVRGASACGPSILLQPNSATWASDDGGAGWHDIGQPIEAQGSMPTQLVAAGTTLFAIAHVLVTPTGCQELPPLATGAPSLWRSNDGGNTWLRVTLPSGADNPDGLIFTPKSNGSGYYGVLESTDPANTVPTSATYYLTSDGGTTWTTLPTLTLSDASANADPGNSFFGALPNGTVVIHFGGPSPIQLFPAGAKTWASYAVSAPGIYQLAASSQGAMLWSSASNLPSDVATVAYLPLP